jgi:hypothetical protein
MRMRKSALATIGLALVLLLTGCHRLGLVKSTASTGSGSTSAAATAAPVPSAVSSSTASVSISVQNGGGIKGRGAAMVAHLKTLGFQAGKATNAKRIDYATTVIYFNPGHEADANRVQKALGMGAVHAATSDAPFSTNVLVVVGKDY